ncbi:MAG: hypothetical protein ACTIN1_02885 [Pseudolactococcus laudensis]
MKTQLNQIGKSALSIINSTIIVLPFMIFIQIANQHTFISVLPFVLFYTFRMTGIFLIRGIKTSFNSYTLLHFSLYCGSLGCLLGVLGTLLGSFIILDKGLSLKSFFVITSTPVQTLKSMQLMTSWNVIATSLIILIILIYGFVYLRPRKR